MKSSDVVATVDKNKFTITFETPIQNFPEREDEYIKQQIIELQKRLEGYRLEEERGEIPKKKESRGRTKRFQLRCEQEKLAQVRLADIDREIEECLSQRQTIQDSISGEISSDTDCEIVHASDSNTLMEIVLENVTTSKTSSLPSEDRDQSL
jgi:hypothetical protein